MARNVWAHSIRHNRFFVPPPAHPSWRFTIDGAAPDNSRHLNKMAEFWARFGA